MQLPGGTRTARGRKLAAELVALREGKGLRRQDVTQRLSLAPSTIYRIETGKAKPQQRTIISLLELYGVQGQRRADLLALAKFAGDRGDWLHAYREMLPDLYVEYIGFESDASVLRDYESLLIPGLLQTEEYARAVISGSLLPATPDDVERRVAVRMQRKAILDGDDPVRLEAVVDEASLWRRVGGPAVMSAQLRALLKPRPNLQLQVIPYSAGAHPGMVGSFIAMEFADPGAADLVYIDSMAGELFREAPVDLERYREIFAQLRNLSLSPRDSASLIGAAARKIARE